MARAIAGNDDASFPRPAYAWYVILVICAANVFGYIDRVILAIITPALQTDLGISDSQAGLLQGIAFALFYTLFGLPLGWLVDRASRKWILATGITLWSAMTALCGLARSFGFLFLTRLGVGVGEASLNPSAASLIGDYFPPRTRSRAFGLFIMGMTIGNGLTYLFGGALLKWLTARGGLDLPVLGPTRPWQGMFVLVGLCGLIPALLFIATVREPRRHEIATRSRASGAQLRAFIAQNRSTMICHHAGIGLAGIMSFSFVNWMPTFFLRVHHWTPADFAVTYGSINIVTGIITSWTAGWSAGWLKERGVVDASWRLSLGGAFGCMICASAAPMVSSPGLALALYLAAGIFQNFPVVLGIAAVAEFVPNEMRGIITATYYLTLGLLSNGLGPFAVGAVTDFVFHDKAAIGKSLMVVTLSAGIPAAILLAAGLKPFRTSLARVSWIAGGAR